MYSCYLLFHIYHFMQETKFKWSIWAQKTTSFCCGGSCMSIHMCMCVCVYMYLVSLGWYIHSCYTDKSKQFCITGSVLHSVYPMTKNGLSWAHTKPLYFVIYRYILSLFWYWRFIITNAWTFFPSSSNNPLAHL